jgi:hypothetical protein
MRKALLAAVLLAIAALALGATVFGGQDVSAATPTSTTPFQQVLVQNTSTNPVQVQQVGTSSTSVSGTVGIDPGKNTVSLDSTDSANLAAVAGHLKNIEAAGAVTPIKSLCTNDQDLGALSAGTVCSVSGSWDISSIVAEGMDDDVIVDIGYNDDNEMQLLGSDAGGTSVYQLSFPRPVRANNVFVYCNNQVEDCKFMLNILGTTNP